MLGTHPIRPRLTAAGLILSSILMLCALCLSAPAQAKELKVGVVDVGQVIGRSRSVQDSVRDAEKRVAPQQDQVEAKMNELRRLQQDLSDRRSVLKPTEIETQQRKIQSLKEEAEDLQHAINKQIDRIQNEVMDPQIKRIVQAVQAVAKREGFDLVVRAEAVLYQNDVIDMTPLVVQELDRSAAPSTAPKTPTRKSRAE